MDRSFGSFRLFIVAVSLVLAVPATLLGQDFYHGKTIRIIVGPSIGGGYDLISRLLARHMSKYIPGNPNIIVQNMPGAGSLIAAQHIYNIAKPDGLSIATWNSVFVLHQALADKMVTLDTRKMGWVGAAREANPACAVMGFTGTRTLQDVIKSPKPIAMGSVRGIPEIVPKILNMTLGTKFDIVPGYAGSSAIRAAMERREVDGVCLSWESMASTARHMLDAKGDDKLIPFLVHRQGKDPILQNLPQIPQVIKGEENLLTYKAWAATTEFHTPFTVPPGTPRERLALLRSGFNATLQDQGFLADAKKAGMDIHYTSGEEIEKLVQEILSIPPRVKTNLQFVLE